MEIQFSKEKCVGCGACEIACMDQNDIRPAFFKIVEENDKETLKFRRRACLHCKDAACIKACKQNGIFRDEQTDMVVLDKEKCIGCGECITACPLGILVSDGLGYVHKCDGCYVRLKMGMQPACVLACPFDAMELR